MNRFLAVVSAFIQAFVLFPLAARATSSSSVYSGLGEADDALGQVGTTAYGTSSTDASALPTLIGNIINVVLGVLGIVMVVYIVWAGWIYASSGGEKEKLEKAKKMISSAVIGLILIVAAYAIAAYVVGALVSIRGSSSAAPG